MHSVIRWMNSEDLMRSIVILLSNTVLSVHVWENSCSVMSYSLQPQAPQFVRFFRPEYWSGLPFCSPGDLPDPGMETTSPALAGVFSTTEPSGKPSLCCILESYWVQFSHSVVSDSLQPHGVQHTRLHCPSPTPRACSNSCPWSWGCHPTISSSVVPFSSCLQSFSASGFFPMSLFFTLDGQSTGASASASVHPMNIQDWFPLGLTGWISLQSKGLSRVFSNTTVQKHQFFSAQLSL